MNNNKFYKIGIAVSILLIALVVVFIVLANKADNKVAKEQENLDSVMSSSGEVEEGDEIISIEDFEEIATETTDKKTENTSSGTQNTVDTSSKAESNEVKNTENTKSTVSKESKQENVSEDKNVDPVFCYPVEGEVSIDYAKDKLVYSETLGEWITHLGIDIKADKTTVVKASADGTVKSIKNDPRYGLTVVIEHSNGFSTVYSNLLTAEFVNIGEKVTSGQTIGTVGNTASFEILDESHLHFEILKDNEQIDPNMYLKK